MDIREIGNPDRGTTSSDARENIRYESKNHASTTTIVRCCEESRSNHTNADKLAKGRSGEKGESGWPQTLSISHPGLSWQQLPSSEPREFQRNRSIVMDAMLGDYKMSILELRAYFSCGR